MTNKRRVVITGMGAVTPVGLDVNRMWESVKNNECGIAPITLYDTSEQQVKLAAEVKNFDPTDYMSKKDARHLDRVTQFAIVAAEEAWKDSGLTTSNFDPSRACTFVSSGIAGIKTIEDGIIRGLDKGFDRVSPYFIPMILDNMPAAQIAINYGLKGICASIPTACAAGANALGEAMIRIQSGRMDLAVAGGAESTITRMGIGGFTAMKALTTTTDASRASIPFDADRSGYVMGEGAGILILEEREHALARGAKIYAELSGYGANCDAYHITAPMPDGSGAAQCILEALNDAGLKPSDIDYVNAHGTSTKLNDSSEAMAIRGAFGEEADRILVSSSKSIFGHLLGASGAVESIVTILALRDQFAPANLGYEIPDPECNINIVGKTGKEAKIRNAISNNFGFGGHNATLVFSKVD